jgi:adenylosuccinate synthase
LPAGSYIVPEMLADEIRMTGLPPERLIVDGSATIVSAVDQIDESAGGLVNAIGSTGSGTGNAVINRIARLGKARLARDVPELAPYIGNATEALRSLLDKHARVVIEGTQGFGLSVLHGGFYPYATSREVTAAGALAETGLSPLDVDDVTLVIRAFPIRVGGNSGPLPGETSWDGIVANGAHDHPIIEYTTVTHRVRRVAAFDSTLVRRAVVANRPSCIVMNHLDYVDHASCVTGEATPAIADFVREIEGSIGRTIDRWGVAPASLIPNSLRQSESVRHIDRMLTSNR